MDPQILQRIKNCKTLPAIPALPLQVLQMCRDDKASAQKVGEVISKDPSFVAKLLNVANSSFYGGSRHKVATVTHAVTLLGMNSIATLAFCFSLYRDLRKKGGGAFDHTHFWHRCILASLAAKILAKRVRVINQEEIFLAGLLQDLGVLVMSEAFGNEYGALYQKANQDHHALEALEQGRWKTDHCEIGAWLAETWELPEVLREAVRGSHNPSLASSEDEVSRLTISCVALSGRWLICGVILRPKPPFKRPWNCPRNSCKLILRVSWKWPGTLSKAFPTCRRFSRSALENPKKFKKY